MMFELFVIGLPFPSKFCGGRMDSGRGEHDLCPGFFSMNANSACIHQLLNLSLLLPVDGAMAVARLPDEPTCYTFASRQELKT
jgi:hypothetical protein